MNPETPNQSAEPTGGNRFNQPVCVKPAAAAFGGSRSSSAMRALLCSTGFLLLIVVGCSRYTSDCTRGQSSVCELHHIQMTKTNVPIIYGLFRRNAWGKAREAARTNTFPHAADEALGGCILDDPTNAIIYVCPACLTAKSRWELEHPRPSP